MTAPQATDIAPPTVYPGRLHRPVRAAVAAAELVAAGLAVWGAFWAWPHGFATITTVVGDGTSLDSQRVFGNWLAGAIAFGTVAAVLVIDAVREVVLAVRARPKKIKQAKGLEPVPAPATPPAMEVVSDAVSDAKVTGDD